MPCATASTSSRSRTTPSPSRARRHSMRSPSARASGRARCTGTIRRARRSSWPSISTTCDGWSTPCAEVLAAHPPLDAFQSWFHTLADYVRVKHGLGEALHTAAAKDAINATYAPVVAPWPRSSTPASPTAACATASTPATCSCSWDSCGGCPTDRPASAGRPDDGHRDRRAAARRNHLSSLDIRRSANTLPPV